MSEHRYRELLEHEISGVLSLDLEGLILSADASTEKLLGYGVEDLFHTPFMRLVLSQDYQVASKSFQRAVRNEPQSVEVVAVHRSGRQLQVSLTLVPITLGRGVVAVSVIAQDITGRRALEEQLLHEALHDPLTGLFNRALFADRLEHALDRLGRNEGSLAVLFLDLDDFKLINDTFGHAAGDEILKVMGRRLRTSVRPADTAARLGGDEFAILIEGDPLANEPDRTAERILGELQKPILLHGRRFSITVSIGVSLTASSQVSPEELLCEADLNMYRAKTDGKNRRETSAEYIAPTNL